jgi:preprotein translocase subunit YajC
VLGPVCAWEDQAVGAWDAFSGPGRALRSREEPADETLTPGDPVTTDTGRLGRVVSIDERWAVIRWADMAWTTCTHELGTIVLRRR